MQHVCIQFATMKACTTIGDSCRQTHCLQMHMSFHRLDMSEHPRECCNNSWDCCRRSRISYKLDETWVFTQNYVNQTMLIASCIVTGAGLDSRGGIFGLAVEAGKRAALGRHLPDGCSARLSPHALLPRHPNCSPGSTHFPSSPR